MPIVHFVNCKTQSAGGMKNVIDYIEKESKTKFDSGRLITGINCSAQSAYDEFIATKNMFGKTGGRLYYHVVQSFPKGSDIDPQLAHKIACEFAEKAFGKYECVVATHIDREHIHSHFVFNSVSFMDGKKYHSNLDSVTELMRLSDEICMKYNIEILNDPNEKLRKDKKKAVLTDREYRSAEKGESFKFELMNVIDQVMKRAKSRRQFLYLMRQYGYGVRWEDTRKYITYTTPTGRRCRCNKLHGTKYSKEMMELEFKIREAETAVRQGHYHGGGYPSGSDSAGRELERSAGAEREDVQYDALDPRSAVGAAYTGGNGADIRVSQADRRLHGGSVSGGVQAGSGACAEVDNRGKGHDESLVLTGWEAERSSLFRDAEARRIQAELRAENAQNNADLAADIGSIIYGVGAVDSLINGEPTEDEPVHMTTESKLLKKEWEKKAALGLKM